MPISERLLISIRINARDIAIVPPGETAKLKKIGTRPMRKRTHFAGVTRLGHTRLRRNGIMGLNGFSMESSGPVVGQQGQRAPRARHPDENRGPVNVRLVVTTVFADRKVGQNPKWICH